MLQHMYLSNYFLTFIYRAAILILHVANVRQFPEAFEEDKRELLAVTRLNRENELCLILPSF